MKQQWHSSKNGIDYYVKVDPKMKQIVAWEEGGIGDPRDMGGNCSFDDFMKGSYRKLIKEQHGETVLQEVVELVKKLRR